MSICMRKVGMTQIMVDDAIVAVTLLFSKGNRVIGHKTVDRDGYDATILGFGKGKIKSWNKPQHKAFESEDNFVPEEIYESRMESVISFDKGQDLPLADLFPIGSYIDVSGKTKGRGWAGVMKRWNFKGLPASHGATKSHRSAGSTGCRTYLGRVPKGKKMAGRYGFEQQTIQSLKVLDIKNISEDNLNGTVLFVKGAVPGANNGLCFVKKAIKRGAK